MGKKYVIELEDEPIIANRVKYWQATKFPTIFFSAEELNELEEYKEPEEKMHELKVGDVCYMPGAHDNEKLLVTKIGPYITSYMRSNGSSYGLVTRAFKEKAVFMYHSDLFEAFLKGDFT